MISQQLQNFLRWIKYKLDISWTTITMYPTEYFQINSYGQTSIKDTKADASIKKSHIDIPQKTRTNHVKNRCNYKVQSEKIVT